MKKIIFSIAALSLMVSAAQAQISYGIKTGLNFPKLKVSVDGGSAESEASTSFYFTGYLDAPIASNLSIQPGLSLQGKGGKSQMGGESTKTDLMYLEIPVNFVYYVPTGAGNIFLGAGPYAAVGLSAKQKTGNISADAEFGSRADQLKRVDGGLNFLLGYKFSNGFLLNGGYGLGLVNMNNSDGAKATNKVLSVGVGFQL